MNTHPFKYSTSKDLGILRAVTFGIWFIIILLSPITKYSSLPIELFEPIGIYKWIFFNTEGFFTQTLLSEKFLLFLKIAALCGCLLASIGTKFFRAIALSTVFFLFVIDAIFKGFSATVNHSELGILYAAFIIALFPSANGFALFNKEIIQNKDVKYGLPIFIVAFTLCMAYAFVGVHRLIYGNLEQFYNHALEIYLIRNSLNYSLYSFDWGLFVVSSTYLLNLFKAGFFIITIFEALSPFILVNKIFRYLWLAVMIPFHLLSLFTMNIFFWENLILIVVLFIILSREKRIG